MIFVCATFRARAVVFQQQDRPGRGITLRVPQRTKA
jgi:hypothetical protein